MLKNIEVHISDQGIEAITVPFAQGQRQWLNVLRRSTWALDLLHGTIRHHSRAIARAAATEEGKQR